MLQCNAGKILLGCTSAPSLWPYWWPSCLQNESPWSSSWAWGKEKIKQSKIRWIGWLFQCCDIPTGQELSEAQSIVSIGVVKQPQFILPQLSVSSCALSKAYTAGYPCRLVDWSSGPVARACCGQYPLHQSTLSTSVFLKLLEVMDRLIFFNWCTD